MISFAFGFWIINEFEKLGYRRWKNLDAMNDFSFSTKQNKINSIRKSLAFDPNNLLMFLVRDTKINL